MILRRVSVLKRPAQNRCPYFCRDAGISTERIVARKAYDALHKQRMEQASRSLLFELTPDVSAASIVSSLQQFVGSPQVPAFLCTKKGIKHMQESMVLVELENQDQVNWVRKQATRRTNPMPTRMFEKKYIKSLFPATNVFSNVRLLPSRQELDGEKLLAEIRRAQSVAQQAQILISKTDLTEQGVRIRYLIASMVEECLVRAKLFPKIKCCPFGSTANGFGKEGCDLDMMFSAELDDDEIYEDSFEAGYKRVGMLLSASQAIQDLGRRGDTSFRNMRRIVTAFVPILKFDHLPSGIECDLAYHKKERTNRYGLYMSELFWIYAQLHPNVRSLIFTLRLWASIAQMTSHYAGPWITNFQLICFVLHFLVHKKKLLPSSKDIIDYYNIVQPARQSKKETVYEPEISLTAKQTTAEKQQATPKARTTTAIAPEFPDWQQFPDFENLLVEFLEYFGSECRLDTDTISMDSGSLQPKPKMPACVYFPNPFDPAHNMTRNITGEELTLLRETMLLAAKTLRSASSEPTPAVPWGILSILQPQLYKHVLRPSADTTRVAPLKLDLSSIFGESQMDSLLKPVKEASSTATSASTYAESNNNKIDVSSIFNESQTDSLLKGGGMF